MGITAGSREVPGRNACDRRHTYRIIIIIMEKNVTYREENILIITIKFKYFVTCYN